MSADQHLLSEKYVLNLEQKTRPISASSLLLGGANSQGETLAFTNYYLTHNGHPTIPVMGEFHFSRFPRQYWAEELRKMQAGGITIVASYVFWIYVEEEEGIFDWSGNNDLRAFTELCQELKMPFLLRIGPFAHGECRNGGLPDWLYGHGIPVRTNDERYLHYVRLYFAQLAEQVKGLLFDDGGVLMGIQIENEYMHAGAPWEVTFRQGVEWVSTGSDGISHMLLLKQLAMEAGLQVPIYTCTGWIGSPVPEDEYLPMHGGYAFTPWSPDPLYRQGPTSEFLFRDRYLQPLAHGEVPYDATRYPYASCELGGGIQITYHHRPTVPPEAVQAMAIVALGGGANWLGYYMYHGGSHPVGKHTYLNEYTVPRISYDFQAPIREFGQINQSYHRLRALHLFLQDFDELLAPMMVTLSQESASILPEDAHSLRYAARGRDGSGFIFLNNYQDHVALVDHVGIRIRLDLPGESLTVPAGPEGFTLRQGVSTIFPFNLHLESGILLKYATAQLLTRLVTPEGPTYVFFAPEGIASTFALDHATYNSLKVTGGTVLEDDVQAFITVEAGLGSKIQINTRDNRSVHFLILTQEQGLSCWKTQLWGQERLLLTTALPVSQADGLHLSWSGQPEIDLMLYPPLPDTLLPNRGELREIRSDIFTHYLLSVPRHEIEMHMQSVSSDMLRLGLSATALVGVEDVFLSIDYLGDTGQAYLDGRLISDHFANGLPWEIGLKRFIHPGEEKELILHISPLQRNSTALSYFPTGMAFRPMDDGNTISEIHGVSALPAYRIVLNPIAEQTNQEPDSK